MEWVRDVEAEEAIRRVERSVDVQRALSRLTAQQREILLLRTLMDLSWFTISQIVGMDCKQIPAVYAEAVSALRRELE